MKKILLTTAAVAAISTSAFADMMENQFYLRGDVSGTMFSKFKTSAEVKGNEISAKIKPKLGFGLDVGAGYYIMDNVRAELVYNQPFSPNLKGSKATGAEVSLIKADDTETKLFVKHKPTIHALFARISGDVVDLGMGKIFLTAGAGWSQVQDKITLSADTSTVTQAQIAAATEAAPVVSTKKITELYTGKVKNKNNLAWTVGAGAAFDIAEGVHLDVAYSYRDYGKAKSPKKSEEFEYKAKNFSSHNLSAGVRFDI